MEVVHPEVYLVAKTSVDPLEMLRYLASVDPEAARWWQESRLDLPEYRGPAELLAEFAGRLCYKSWRPGLNPNVTRIREDSRAYFANLLASGHGSVLEHATFSFVFQGVSRVFTHELVRHRVGTAVSQESLRYVRLDKFKVTYSSILGRWFGHDAGIDPEAGRQEAFGEQLPFRRRMVEVVERLEELFREAGQEIDEVVGFAEKKRLTSALRRLAPQGLATDILWTANVRTLRHVLTMRTDLAAEEEMRTVFGRVGELCQREAPQLFGDFAVTREGHWVPDYEGV